MMLYLQVNFPVSAGMNHLVGNFGWHCWLAWYLDATLVPASVFLLPRPGLSERYQTTLAEFIDFSAILCCGQTVRIVEQVAEDVPRHSLEITVQTKFEHIKAAAAQVRMQGDGLLVLNIKASNRIFRSLPAFIQALRKHGQWSPRTCGFYHPVAAEPRRIANIIVERMDKPYTCIHVRRGDYLIKPVYAQHTTPDAIARFLDACGLRQVYLMSDEAPEFFAPLRERGFHLFQYTDFPELRALVEKRVCGGHMLYAVERELMRQASRRVLTHSLGFGAFCHTDLFNPYASCDYTLLPPHGPHRPLPELDVHMLRKLSAGCDDDRDKPALYLQIDDFPVTGMPGQIETLTCACQLARYLDATLAPSQVGLPVPQNKPGSTTLADFIDFSTLVYRGRPMSAIERVPDNTPHCALTLTADTLLEQIETAATALRAEGAGRLLLTVEDVGNMQSLDIPAFQSIPEPDHALPIWAETLTYSAAAEPKRIAEVIINQHLGDNPYTCIHLHRSGGDAAITPEELIETTALCGLGIVYLMADEALEYVSLLADVGYQVYRYTDFPELRELAERPVYGEYMLYMVEHELMHQSLWQVRAKQKGNQTFVYAEQIHPHPEMSGRVQYMVDRSV